jgi:hypothetical protein
MLGDDILLLDIDVQNTSSGVFWTFFIFTHFCRREAEWPQICHTYDQLGDTSAPCLKSGSL